MLRLVRMVTDTNSPWYSAPTRVILVTPPPVNTYQRGADLHSRDPPKLLDRSFETTRKYAEAVVQVGSNEGVPVVDIWNAIYDAAGRDEKLLTRFLSDGLHLNADGYDVSRYTSFLRASQRCAFPICRSSIRAWSIWSPTSTRNFTTTGFNLFSDRMFLSDATIIAVAHLYFHI